MYVSFGCHRQKYETFSCSVDSEDGECHVHTVSLHMKLSREEAAQLHSQLERYLSASAAPSICSKE